MCSSVAANSALPRLTVRAGLLTKEEVLLAGSFRKSKARHAVDL
jgi:hypothetical protein